MNVKGTLPHRVGGSRWMPHIKKALETLFRTYPAFISHLQNESHQNAKAEGLAKIMDDFNIIAFAILLQVLCKLKTPHFCNIVWYPVVYFLT